MILREPLGTESPAYMFDTFGAGAMSTAQLISLVVGVDEEAAQRVLAAGPDGILNLVEAPDGFKDIPGIGASRARKLACIGELGRRIAAETRHMGDKYASPEDIAAHYMDRMRHEPNEMFVAAFFKADCSFLGETVLSVGSSLETAVSPADVFRAAIAKRARVFVILHNHPSGNPAPSKSDEATTRVMKKLGEMMQIPLLDHIIIGDGSFYSFKRSSPIFKE